MQDADQREGEPTSYASERGCKQWWVKRTYGETAGKK